MFRYLVEVDYAIKESQKRVLALAAGGVGGGILVHTYVTEKLDPIVIYNWGAMSKQESTLPICQNILEWQKALLV